MKASGSRFSRQWLVFGFVFILLYVSAYSPLLHTVSAANTTYYVDSAGGSDSNSGTSSSQAWKSLAKVNATTFGPGDRILFKAGGVWNGQLWPKGSGAPGSPIVIDMYGAGGKPIINGNGTTYPAQTSGAVFLYNQEYWEINNLEVTNNSSTIISSRSGILVMNNEAGLKQHIYIRDTYVHDVNSDPNGNKNSGGIIFFGTHINKDGVATLGRQAGFNDVLVENNHVRNVAKEGIRNKSDAGNGNYPRINTNIVFRGNLVEDIWGDGMVLAEVLSGAVAEHNIIKNHSKTTSGNYAGLWTHVTTEALVQYNEVFGGTEGYNDGEAFDSDNNCYGDIFQYNYSHDNRGGLLLVMPSAQNLKFRYNISQNDGGGLNNHLFHYGNNNTNYIYNNTIYVGNGLTNYLFAPVSNATVQPKFYNNIVMVDGGSMPKLSNKVTWGAGTDFKNNLFYPATIDDVGGPPSHPGLVTSNPQFVGAGTGGSMIDMNDPNRLSGYKLQATSPAIGAGLNLGNHGGKDFWGTPLYSGGADIGAYEHPAGGGETGEAFNASADAYVRDGVHANTNFGNDAVLSVKSDASGYARKAYARFDYGSFAGSGAPSAKLKLFVDSVNTDTSRTISVYATADKSWSETGITLSNAPAVGTYLGDIVISNAAGVWYELDVTSYVNTHMADKKVSFLLVNSGAAGSTNDVHFASREAGANGPKLVLETGNVPFLPTADTYVRDGSYAGTNYGTASAMTVKSDAAGYARKAYMRFNYSAYTGSSTASAKLKLYVDSVNEDVSRTVSIYATADKTWSETGLTWNNAPAGSAYLGSITVSNAGGVWYELDVTGYVNANMADKTVSFLLVNEGPASSKNDVHFATRESALNQPQLIIQ